MAINALGYIGIRSDLLEDWSQFAGGLLGMQRVDRAGKQLAFRMDDRMQRLIVADEPGETLAFCGLGGRKSRRSGWLCRPSRNSRHTGSPRHGRSM